MSENTQNSSQNYDAKQVPAWRQKNGGMSLPERYQGVTQEERRGVTKPRMIRPNAFQLQAAINRP